MKKVVIIGGGSGPFVVTKVLKDFDLELSKIVTVFDSGGSTARLKDEFGFLPVGDLRQSLAALASDNGNAWVQKLLLYRFDKGDGLKGHNLGNLILTALQDMTGSTPRALEVAAKSFRLKGKIYPVTTDKSELIAELEDGETLVGEHLLDDMSKGGRRIKKIRLSQPCKLYPKAEQAIVEADYIILGPGDLYASIFPNLVVEGMVEALAQSHAKFIYISNLMTRFTQTHGYTAKDHLAEVERYAMRKMDFVLVNTGEIDPEVEKHYSGQKEFPVVDDLGEDQGRNIVRGDFASSVKVEQQVSDSVPRALMRHDKKKLAQALLEIL